MKFAVRTVFYDNTASEPSIISRPYVCGEKAVSSMHIGINRVIYVDVFDTYNDAFEYYRNNLEAMREDWEEIIKEQDA